MCAPQTDWGAEELLEWRNPEYALTQMTNSFEAHLERADTTCASLHLCDWYIVKAKMSMHADISSATSSGHHLLQSVHWAVSTRLSVSGWQHPSTWDAILCNLVLQQLQSPNGQIALELIDQVVTAQIAVLGSDHEHVMLSQQLQAHLLLRQQNFDEARQLVARSYQHLMHIDGKAPGCYHLITATALNLWAMRHSQKVRYHQSRELMSGTNIIHIPYAVL